MSQNTSPKSRWIFAAVLAFSLFAFAHGIRYFSQQSLTVPIVFDEAYNLEIPWHLAREGIYGTHQAPAPGETSYRQYILNPYITTGPSVLYPIAWGYELFGGSLAGVARRIVLLFAILGALSFPIFLYERVRRVWILVPATWVSLLILNAGDWPGTALRILGEGPGVCFFLLAVFCADAGIRRKNTLLILGAGVLAGLSVHAKLLFLLPWGGVGLWLIAGFFRKEKPRWGISEIGVFVAGFLGCLIAWEILQVSILGGWDGYVAYKKGYVDFFLNVSGGPLPRSEVGGDEWRKACSRNWKTVVGMFRKDKRVLVLTAIGILAVIWKVLPARVTKRSDDSRNLDPWVALLIASALYFAWFIFSSGLGWPRHIVPATALLSIGAVGALLELLALRFPRMESKPLVVAFAIGCLAIAVVRLTKPPHWGLVGQYQAQQAIAKLEAEKHPIWIVQTDSTFDPALYLFAETNVMPALAVRKDGSPSVCDMELRKGEYYAIITENRELSDSPFWRCVDSPKVDVFTIDIEVCPANKLRCESRTASQSKQFSSH
jgi:hypothetical protein